MSRVSTEISLFEQKPQVLQTVCEAEPSKYRCSTCRPGKERNAGVKPLERTGLEETSEEMRRRNGDRLIEDERGIMTD